MTDENKLTQAKAGHQEHGRRRFLLGLGAAAGLSGCAIPATDNLTSDIDARVSDMLERLYSTYPETATLRDKSAGVLVMPLVTEVGFPLIGYSWAGVGGAFGLGALQIEGVSVDYYSVTSASYGLQLGGQQYSHILFFMTADGLLSFRRSEGWAIDEEIEYALKDKSGQFIDFSTLPAQTRMVMLTFDKVGYFVGATLGASKYKQLAR